MVKTVIGKGQRGCVSDDPGNVEGLSPGFVDFRDKLVDCDDSGSASLGDHTFTTASNIDHPPCGDFLNRNMLLPFCHCSEYHLHSWKVDPHRKSSLRLFTHFRSVGVLRKTPRFCLFHHQQVGQAKGAERSVFEQVGDGAQEAAKDWAVTGDLVITGVDLGVGYDADGQAGQ